MDRAGGCFKRWSGLPKFLDQKGHQSAPHKRSNNITYFNHLNADGVAGPTLSPPCRHPVSTLSAPCAQMRSSGGPGVLFQSPLCDIPISDTPIPPPSQYPNTIQHIPTPSNTLPSQYLPIPQPCQCHYTPIAQYPPNYAILI